MDHQLRAELKLLDNRREGKPRAKVVKTLIDF